MNIDSRTLISILTTARLRRAGFQMFGPVISAVRRFYCTPMDMSRLCPQDCQKCKVTLEGIIDSIHPQGARDLNALLLYHIRKTVGELKDAAAERSKVEIRAVDPFDTPDRTDVWSGLLQEMTNESQTSQR